MALTPSGVQTSTKYTLTGPDGTVATFNDSTDANFIGYLTETTGLDSPEVRENAENIAGADGGIHGSFYYGRRPITLAGSIINVTSSISRNAKITKLQQASNAMRADAVLSWTPEGGEEQFVKVRRSQPLRVTGGWNKDFQLLLVSADPRIYAKALSTAAIEIAAPTPLAVGTEPSKLAVSADGKNVYVVNKGSNTVSQFARSLTTGRLTALGTPTVATGASPYDIQIYSAAGKSPSVYVSNMGANTISKYSRNESTGALTVLGAAIAAGEEPMGMCIASVNEAKKGALYVACKKSNEVRGFERAESGELTAAAAKSTGAATGPVDCAPCTTKGANKRIAVACFTDNTVKYYVRADGTGAVEGLFNSVAVEAGPVSIVADAPQNNVQQAFVLVCQNGVTNTLIGMGTAGNTALLITGSSSTVAALPTGANEVILAPFASEGNSGYMYVSNETNNLIYQYSYSANNSGVITFAQLSKPTAPSGSKQLGLAAYASNVYSANKSSNSVWEYSTSSGVLIRKSTVVVTASCVNKGSMETFPVLIMKIGGAAGNEILNPTIENTTTGEAISLEGTFGINSTIEVDLTNRTVRLNGALLFSAVNVEATKWFSLVPGTNELSLTGDNSEGVKLSIEWRSAWI